MKNDVSTAASKRFDGIAANYAASEVHARSSTMRRLHQILGLSDRAAVCDVACGAGHLALSFGPCGGRLVGVDPAPRMLEVFQSLARERGVAVEAVQARAEALPFADGSFDAVVSRLAAHHFGDVPKAIREMARLAKCGGWVGVIDLEGDPDPTLDELNQRIEQLHDPSHVRSYTALQWRGFFEQAGLEVCALENKQHEIESGLAIRRWCEIGNSGAKAEAGIRKALSAAGPEALRSLEIRAEQGEYFLPIRTVLIAGRKG